MGGMRTLSRLESVSHIEQLTSLAPGRRYARDSRTFTSIKRCYSLVPVNECDSYLHAASPISLFSFQISYVPSRYTTLYRVRPMATSPLARPFHIPPKIHENAVE